MVTPIAVVLVNDKELDRPVALSPTLDIVTDVKVLPVVVDQADVMSQHQRIAVTVEGYLRGGQQCLRVIDMHGIAQHTVVALVAGQVEEGGKLGSHGHIATSGVGEFHAIIARVHVLHILVGMRTTVLQALCVVGVIGHGIDEVLHVQVGVFGAELETISHGTQIELATADDVVAYLDEIVQLFILCSSSVILVNRGSRVDGPVDIELGQQGLCHILRGGTVIGTAGLRGQQRDDVEQLLLYPSGHIATRLAVADIDLSIERRVDDGSVAPAVHHDKLEVSAHGPCRGLVLLLVGLALDNLVRLDAACSQLAHPVDGGILVRVIVQGGMRIGIGINPASRIGDSRLLVARQGHGLHIPAAKDTAQLIIDTRQLCLQCHLAIGEGGVL